MDQVEISEIPSEYNNVWYNGAVVCVRICKCPPWDIITQLPTSLIINQDSKEKKFERLENIFANQKMFKGCI